MPQLAADKGLRLWVTVIPKEAVASALQNGKYIKVRYHCVLPTDTNGPTGLDAATAKKKTVGW
jgi:hypothetical protein